MPLRSFRRLGSRIPWGPCGLLLVVIALGQTRFMHSLEWRSLDWRTHVRAWCQPPADPRIAVVLFDDDTEARIGHWPVDRKWHATLVQLCALAEAAVVSWDVILDASNTAEGDALMAGMAQAAEAAGTKVVSAAVTNAEPTGAVPGLEGPTRPLPNVTGDIQKLWGDAHAFIPFSELRATSWYGFADTPPTADGVRREIPLVVRVGGAVYPTLSLQTLLVYFGVKPEAVRIVLGDAIYFMAEGRERRLPVSERGCFLLNYRYDHTERPTDLPLYGYASLLFGLNDHYIEEKKDTLAPPSLKGRIIFVGQVVSGKADAGPTPLKALSPLVFIHANLVNNVLADDYAQKVPAAVAWGTVIGLGLLGGWISRCGRPWAVAGFALAAVVAYGVAAFGLWMAFSLWLPLVGPLAAIGGVQFYHVLDRVLQEQRAKDQIKGMFNSYLSPELLRRMIKQGELASVGSERKPVTILFSDLRDFTSWSERTQEDVLIAQLNEYLEAMVECIHAHGGTLHKFIGDAVMAVWGDLVSEGPAADAAQACRAALAMQARLEELNATWRDRGLQTLRMGIGLNHGTVLVGNIGSPRRMEFTVIGDAVNLASRLEGLNKEMKTSTLAGETVYALLPVAFVWRSLGAVAVKGKAQTVAVFELIAVQAASG